MHLTWKLDDPNNDLQSVIPVIVSFLGLTLEIIGVLGMADTVRRSKDPSFASVSINAIHSATAQAV